MGFEKSTFEQPTIDSKKEQRQKIALTKEELPPLKEGYVRAVHLTRRNSVEGVLKTGLNYRGILSSTARSWAKENEKEIEFSTSDPRFQGEDMVAVVFDIPMNEHRLHEDVVKSPEKIPPEYIVGVVSEGEKL